MRAAGELAYSELRTAKVSLEVLKISAQGSGRWCSARQFMVKSTPLTQIKSASDVLRAGRDSPPVVIA